MTPEDTQPNLPPVPPPPRITSPVGGVRVSWPAMDDPPQLGDYLPVDVYRLEHEHATPTPRPRGAHRRRDQPTWVRWVRGLLILTAAVLAGAYLWGMVLRDLGAF